MFNNTILTKEESWFLGVFHSDGCLIDNTTLKFEMNDLDVIEKLRNISGGNSIRHYTENSYQYRVSINKLNIGVSLEDLQILPRKSLILKYPAVDLSFPDYLRGVVDGDGSFGRYKLPRGFTIRFFIYSGSVLYASSIYNHLNEYGVSLIKRVTKHSPIYSITKSGNQALKILDYIYQDSTEETRMNRKYVKYINLKQAHEEYCQVVQRKRK